MHDDAEGRPEHVKTIASVLAQLVLAAGCAVVFFWLLAGVNAYHEDIESMRARAISNRVRGGPSTLTMLSLLVLSGGGAGLFVVTSALTVWHAKKATDRARAARAELRAVARRIASSREGRR